MTENNISVENTIAVLYRIMGTYYSLVFQTNTRSVEYVLDPTFVIINYMCLIFLFNI